MVISPSLVSLLINFVIFYALAGGGLILEVSCLTFIGLAYLLIYAGAVAVLFVFVVLLIENQHLALAVPSSGGQAGPGSAAFVSWGVSRAGVSLPRKITAFTGPLTLEPLNDLALGLSLYGENFFSLAVAG